MYVPVLPDFLQSPPNEGVESTKCHNRNQQRDEEGTDHVVTKKVPQGISRCNCDDGLLPVLVCVKGSW